VRAHFRTDDGALIYVQQPGIFALNDTVTNALATGGSTEFGDQYFRATPRFETGDSGYSWMMSHVFVSIGRVYQGGVQYQVYRVD